MVQRDVKLVLHKKSSVLNDLKCIGFILKRPFCQILDLIRWHIDRDCEAFCFSIHFFHPSTVGVPPLVMGTNIQWLMTWTSMLISLPILNGIGSNNLHWTHIVSWNKLYYWDLMWIQFFLLVSWKSGSIIAMSPAILNGIALNKFILY